jgi:hypothetical protein
VSEQDAIAEAMDRVREHQKTAVQLPAVVEARTIVDICRQGLLSVHSSRHEGYPVGSLVGYATDEQGSPILAISSLSPHTQVSMKITADRSDFFTCEFGTDGSPIS